MQRIPRSVIDLHRAAKNGSNGRKIRDEEVSRRNGACVYGVYDDWMGR